SARFSHLPQRRRLSQLTLENPLGIGAGREIRLTPLVRRVGLTLPVHPVGPLRRSTMMVRAVWLPANPLPAARRRSMPPPDAPPRAGSPEPAPAPGQTGSGAAGFPNDRRKRNIPVATDRRRAQNAAEKRKNSERRRLIDPTTCERDYNDEETEFMKAMDRYKRDNRRPFPTWSEVLEVLRSLGYRRVAEPTALPGKSSGAVPTPTAATT